MNRMMKRWTAVAFCVVLGMGMGAAQKARYSQSHSPDPLEWPLTIHVTNARLTGSGAAGVLHLDAVIDGKKVELEAPAGALLHIGDYQGRVAATDEKKSGWFSKSYELLFSDRTHVIFTEVAESE
jgi:hypothetical protein